MRTREADAYQSLGETNTGSPEALIDFIKWGVSPAILRPTICWCSGTMARDGSICQFAPFNVKTWHAGISHWDGLSGLNSYAIGIEMDNAGPLKKVGDKYQAWFGTLYAEDQVVYAKHRLDNEPCWWQAYTEVRIQRALELAQIFVRHYNLKDVVGHEDIAPDRKRDPGPAFPLEHVRAMVLGREEEEREGYDVTAFTLNIRSGPGIEFLSVAEPLTEPTIK